MTPHEEAQLVAVIEQAVKSILTSTRSTPRGRCAVCEGEIAIGGSSVDLPVTRPKTFTVCGDCMWRLLRVVPHLPGPRPMV
jgi:hypothetical protein